VLSGPVFLILALTVLVTAIIIGRKHLRNARRQRLMKQPFLREWEEILRGNVALYKHLPEDLRERLHGYINVFLDEKKFEGCGGLQLTDAMKVTIAAQACLLLLKGNPTFYPRLKSIVSLSRGLHCQTDILCRGDSCSDGQCQAWRVVE